jgi:hypothetical protein
LAWTTDPEKQKGLLKECPKGLKKVRLETGMRALSRESRTR